MTDKKPYRAFRALVLRGALIRCGEVLRDSPGLSPINSVTAGISNAPGLIKGAAGALTWVWQEKCKCPMIINEFLGSDHGGWKFNDPVYGTNMVDGTMQHMSANTAAQLTDAQLQASPFFKLSSDVGSDEPFTADTALLGTGSSAYATVNRNRILADAIPALSLPIGANPVQIPGLTILIRAQIHSKTVGHLAGCNSKKETTGITPISCNSSVRRSTFLFYPLLCTGRLLIDFQSSFFLMLYLPPDVASSQSL